MVDWLTAEQRTRNMTAIKSSGTAAERRLAELLREVFPRRKVIERSELPGKPDFYLPGLRLAVFADGCFWHACPKHGRIPDGNRTYWEKKLERNKERDRAVSRELRALDLSVMRVWDHDLRDHTSRVRRRLRMAAT